MFSLDSLKQRSLWLILLLALLLPCELREASSNAYVSTAGELLAAIKDQRIETISLQGNVRLTPASTGIYRLPLLVSGNRSLEINSATPAALPPVLDFGNVSRLLYVDGSSTLAFVNLTLQGAAPRSDSKELSTELENSPFYPTIHGADGHSVIFNNTDLHLSSGACTPEALLAWSGGEPQAQKQGSTEPPSHATLYITGPVTASVPLKIAQTGLQVGAANYTFINSTVTCPRGPSNGTDGVVLFSPSPAPKPGSQPSGSPPASASPAPAPSPAPSKPSDSSSSGGTGSGSSVGGTTSSGGSSNSSGGSSGGSGGSGGSSNSWVWAVVGVAAGLAFSAALAAWVLLGRRQQRRRRERQQQQQEQQQAQEGGEGGDENGLGSKFKALAPIVVSTMDSGLSPQPSQGSPAFSSAPRASCDVQNLGAAMWHTRVGVIEGLDIGDLLGKGSYGCCYKGRWKGAIVAVKIIEQFVHAGKAYDLSREPLLSMSVSHPNVIQTYKLSLICVKPELDPDAPAGLDEAMAESVPGSGSKWGSSTGPVGGAAQGVDPSPGAPAEQISRLGSGSSSLGKGMQQPLSVAASGNLQGQVGEPVSPHSTLPPGLYQTIFIMELADRGSLYSAITAGRFRNPITHELDLLSVLLTLTDIAHGMDYLHGLNICHADLKSQNVLLKSARNDRRGFVCKLADFGLSRMMGHETKVDTGSFGTATHAAPELLEQGLLTKAADVWSFAIIMWEVVANEEAYAGMSALQIIVQVTQHGYRLPIPEDCPAPLAHLIQRCWDADPRQRPGFGQIVEELHGMVRDLRRQVDRAASGPTS